MDSIRATRPGRTGTDSSKGEGVAEIETGFSTEEYEVSTRLSGG